MFHIASPEQEIQKYQLVQDIMGKLKYQIQEELISIFLDLDDNISLEKMNQLIEERWTMHGDPNSVAAKYDEMVNDPRIQKYITNIVYDCMNDEDKMMNEILVYLSGELRTRMLQTEHYTNA